MTEVLFFIAAIGAIAGAIGVVWLQNPFFSVLALVFHLLSLAATNCAMSSRKSTASANRWLTSASTL